MKPKRIMFVRYINTECITKEFNTFKEAVRFVYEEFGISKHREFSNRIRQRIHGQIRDAIKNKENYCGGQWIEISDTNNKNN